MTIPAKLQSYMACGMPILASAEGETEKLINDAKCGVCVPLGDSIKLAEAIIDYNKCNSLKLGENSRNYFLEHFEKNTLMNRMERYFDIDIKVSCIGRKNNGGFNENTDDKCCMWD